MGQLALLGVSERGSLREALDWLIRSGLDGCARATVRQHEDHRRWLLSFFGDCPLAEITYERLCQYRDAEGPNGRGCMIASVRKRLVTMRMALREAERRGLISRVPPWPKLRNDSRPGQRVCSTEHFWRLVDAPGIKQWQRVWLLLAYYTGQRRSDVDTMRWHMVDIPGRQFLRRSTKTRALPGLFPLHAALQRELEMHFEECRPSRSDWVAGKWANAVRDLARLCVAAGIARVSPNDLRRSCESNLRSVGANPAFIRLMLCHSEEVAAKHYIRLTPEMTLAGEDALRKIG